MPTWKAIVLVGFLVCFLWERATARDATKPAPTLKGGFLLLATVTCVLVFAYSEIEQNAASPTRVGSPWHAQAAQRVASVLSR